MLSDESKRNRWLLIRDIASSVRPEVIHAFIQTPPRCSATRARALGGTGLAGRVPADLL
jgi:hypothetical protein